MDNGDDLLALLASAKQAGASDLILAAGAPPSIYVNTRMEAMRTEPLSVPGLNEMVTAFLSEKQRERLDLHRDLDFSFGHAGLGRCRINIHYQRRSLAVAVRIINSDIPDLDELSLPPRLGELTEMSRGLVLVTGPTGSGKSTTLASMLERINQRRRAHVITLEDPIEFAFANKESIIEQREIGDDSPSFAEALRHVVRQKPDIILVGEMRDLDTIAAALTAAETGHLVLATLHTSTAAHTVERIVDAFDSRRQEQICIQLSGSLKAIACQTLFCCQRSGGMVPAVEVMIMTPAIARAIRDRNTHLIDGMIETGGQYGMQTMDAAIARLVRDGMISEEDAMAKAGVPGRLERLLAQVGSERESVGTAVGADGAVSPATGVTPKLPPRPWE